MAPILQAGTLRPERGGCQGHSARKLESQGLSRRSGATLPLWPHLSPPALPYPLQVHWAQVAVARGKRARVLLAQAGTRPGVLGSRGVGSGPAFAVPSGLLAPGHQHLCGPHPRPGD